MALRIPHEGTLGMLGLSLTATVMLETLADLVFLTSSHALWKPEGN